MKTRYTGNRVCFALYSLLRMTVDLKLILFALISHFSTMRVCTRRRSQTLRMWLLIVLLSLHLLVVSLVLSMYHSSCEPHSHPDIQTSISFFIQNTSTSTDTMAAAGSVTHKVEIDSAADDLSKLEALFSHPLYNMPTPPVPDGDWLLKVRTKRKDEERSTQQW